MARTIVAGAPCSGKSTYVREHLQVGDVVYDYDTVHQALSGQASHQHDTRIRPYVLKTRDGVLELLSQSPDQDAWVITSSPNAAELRRLQELIDGEMVLLEVSAEDAHSRCDADQRPEAWHEYIDNWFGSTDIDATAWSPKGRGGMMKKKRKEFRGRLKLLDGGEPGEFEATFATLNVIDLDDDVTVPGAFTDGEAVRIASWGHDWWTLPVGRGAIHEVDNLAVVQGKFFLQTTAGKEHYETIKALGDLQEWSYGFDIIESEPGEFEDKDVTFLKKLQVYEVSPVMLGAGIGTETTDIKAANAGAGSGWNGTIVINSALDADTVKAAVKSALVDSGLLEKLGALSVEFKGGDGEGDDEGDDQGKGAGDDATPRNLAPSNEALRAMLDEIRNGQ